MATNTPFSVLSKINPDCEESWTGKVFLTFDIDWAHDEIICDSLNLVQSSQVAATWFATHNTPLLANLEQDGLFEIGIHPNFNPLLDGSLNSSCSEVIANCMSIVPKAKLVRSHSLVQSERLIDLFKHNGLTHISNLFIPYGSGIQAKPFHVWDQMVMVPHSWQDNVALKMKMGFPSQVDFTSGLHVLDFHPIHVFLNSENLDRYERTRPLHKNPKELIKHRFEGYGTRNRLLELLTLTGQT
jgi:hypothetical protein